MADQAMYHQGNKSVFRGGDSGPCYHPLHTWQENCSTKHKTNRRKFYICADGPHTRLAAARRFHRCTSGKGYYPFPEAEMASKYRKESSAELILKLTRPRWECLHVTGLVRQCACTFRQVTGKVSQICRREDLNRVLGKVIISVLETFEYGHVGIPVIVENVPEERCQLVNLERRWSNVYIGTDGISVFR